MVDYPSAFVLIVCKTLSVGSPDQNSDATGWQNREWDLSQGVIHCKRIEVEVTPQDPSNNQPFSPDQCWHTALTLGPKFDADHPHSPYRFWRVGCPVPTHSSKDPSSPILSWTLPPCPSEGGTVECEGDTAI